MGRAIAYTTIVSLLVFLAIIFIRNLSIQRLTLGEVSAIEERIRLIRNNFETSITLGKKYKLQTVVESDLYLIDGISDLTARKIFLKIETDPPINNKDLELSLMSIKGIGANKTELIMRYLEVK